MKRTILPFAGALALSCLPTQAALYTWLGTTSGDWNTASNWDVNGIPVDSNTGTTELELSKSAGDRIAFNATGTFLTPSTNIPVLGGTSGSSNNTTPQFDVIGGTIAFTVNTTGPGNGIQHISNQSFTNTVGDGNIGNGTASLSYSGVFSQGINRDGKGSISWTVNADGALAFQSNQTSLIFEYGSDRPSIFNLNGGTFSSSNSFNMTFGAGSTGTYFDLTAAGASVTGAFGGDFADLASLNAATGSGMVFRSTTAQTLGSKDNGDGTFTVAVVPEPSALLLGALGFLALLRRRR